MKNLFFEGGAGFMGALTILLIITTAWMVYHFVVALKSPQLDKKKALSKIERGKSIGLFALVTGIMGQLVGLTAMFSAIEAVVQRGEKVIPELVFGGIKVTMIVTIYGLLIFLFSLLLWFIASMIIEKKLS